MSQEEFMHFLLPVLVLVHVEKLGTNDQQYQGRIQLAHLLRSRRGIKLMLRYQE